MKLRSLASALGAGVAAATLAVTAVVAPTAAGAQSNPFERGPAPTATSVLGNGPYSISSANVGLGASGFGGGTIYYPTTTSDGTFGAVVIAPGFTAGSTSYLSLARRVASHGFVAFAIDTNSRFDFPDSRGRQILAALDYLTQSSTVRSRIDTSRLAASGHSMGGGGTLAAANSRSSLQAAVALQPWHSTKTWSRIQVPTMIIGAQTDTIASVASHSRPFYNSIPASSEKALAVLAGQGHFAGNSNPDWQGRQMVSWLKRYVDDDTRYEQFLCPTPRAAQFSDYQDTCPGS
jgi:dienelactone hydrolase